MIRNYVMFFLVGICAVLMFFSFITNFMSKRRRLLLFLMALSAAVLLISDRITYHYDGNITEIGLWATKICKFLAYITYYVIIYIFNQYIKDLLTSEGKIEKTSKIFKAVECILLLCVIVLFISQFTGFYYTYSTDNTYIRSPGYIVSYILPLSAIIMQLIAIVRHRRSLRNRQLIPLFLFTIIPVFAGSLQFYIHGTSLTGTCIVAIVVLLYCFSILDANELMLLSHQKEIDNLNLMVEQTTFALVEAIDAKDNYTNGHSRRVAEYSSLIAEESGKSKAECEKIYLIALLHDVGKIGIPDAIINKKGSLTDDEYATIKSHPKVGKEILSKISISPELSIGASFHHERYDGKGYPFGLKGEEIPEIARIIAVADSYDAMASKRSYRNTLPREKTRSELEKGIGTQFDPQFAKIMIKFLDLNII